MQPEVKQNITEIANSKKSPIIEWDHLAFSVIERELAPDGYKKLNNGNFKGLQIAKSVLPGTQKTQVTRTQKVAAQLIRTFREKSKKDIDDQINAQKASLKDIVWWKVISRMSTKIRIQILEATKKHLDNVNIK